MGILSNVLHHAQHQQEADDRRRAEVYRSLLHWQGKVGGELFGPVPKGTRREFFCLDRSTWVWHEEWTDSDGHHTMTTRYDIRPNGVLKSQGTNQYEAISREEAMNLYNAVELYCAKVMPELERLRNLKK